MKKIIILCVVAMFTTLGYAKPKSIEIISGSGKILLDHSKTATFSFNYDSCYVGEISKGILKEGALLLSDYLVARGEDSTHIWAQTHEFVYERFFKDWNVMNRKRTLLVPESESSNYKIVFYVTALDLGDSAASYFGVGRKTGGVTIVGKIDIIDTSTYEILTSYRVNQIEGDGALTEAYRMWSAYMLLLGDFTRLNMKSK